MQNKIVSTSTGQLSGIYNENTRQYNFFGIPYAEVPTGSLRFKPTVPKYPWEGTRDASQFGAAGPQRFEPTEGDYAEFTNTPEVKEDGWVGSEDNLTLNIWTPGVDDKKRPVMVWIHGGANWLESSRLATYHGDSFVSRGDVVFASLNYRLGVFGFLDTSVIGGSEYAGGHSNGMRDQVTALQWIKENIAQFGGDPNNITVMGESAGSIDISWLLTNGLLDGIAKRVVMMSGVAGLMGLSGDVRTGFTEACGQEWARDLLQRMHIETMPELLQLSTKEIMERILKVADSTEILTYMDSLFWPRMSPGFAPVDPLRAVAQSGSRGIDVLIGYTGYEMGLWLFWDEVLDQHSCEWAAKKIRDFDPVLQVDATKFYENTFPHESTGVAGMHLLGDSIFVMPSMWFADKVSQAGHNVWMYQFDKETNNRQRALHAADQVYLFNKHTTHTAESLLGQVQNQDEMNTRLQLTEVMQDAVLAFARSGNPNTCANPNLPEWPQYNAEQRAVMSFNTLSKVVQDPAKERRDWWYSKVYKPALE